MRSSSVGVIVVNDEEPGMNNVTDIMTIEPSHAVARALAPQTKPAAGSSAIFTTERSSAWPRLRSRFVQR